MVVGDAGTLLWGDRGGIAGGDAVENKEEVTIEDATVPWFTIDGGTEGGATADAAAKDGTASWLDDCSQFRRGDCWFCRR